MLVRDENVIADEVDNRLTVQEGDKILLSQDLMDDFNLTKQNSVKVKMQSVVDKVLP